MNFSLKSSFAYNSLTTFITSCVCGLINVLALIWFAKELGPTELSYYASIIFSTQIVLALLSFGFDQAVIYYSLDRHVWSSAFVLTVLQSIVVVVISFVSFYVYYIISPDGANHVFLIALAVLGSAITTLISTLFAASLIINKDFRYLNYVRLGSTILGVISALIMIDSNLGAISLGVRDLLFSLVTLYFILRKYKANYRIELSFRGLTFSKVWGFSFKYWKLHSIGRIFQRIDYALIAILFSKEILGIYYVIRSFTEGVLGFLLVPVQTVLFGYLSKKKSLAVSVIKKQFYFFWRYIILLSIIIILSYFISPHILHYLGEEYIGGEVLIMPFVLFSGMMFLFEIIKVVSMSLNLHNAMIRARVFQLFCYLVLVYPAVAIWGLIGSVLSLNIATTLLVIFAKKDLTFNYFANKKNLL
jgi:O-antigen/teichoic acid export membrane protein